MKYLYLFTLFFAYFFVSCSAEKDQSETIPVDPAKSLLVNNERAQELLTNKCYVCHSNKVSKGNMLAPPMIQIKEAYVEATSSRDQFIEQFVDFVSQPTRDKAILKDAVEQFSLMAYEGTKKEDLEQIAAYIYDQEIEVPDWWGSKELTKDTSIAAVGLNYALSTKKALGKRLMGALEKGGASHAVEFCNTRAIPITDSVSNHFNAQIKRVSDRPRNPNNKANSNEVEIIKTYKNLLREGGDLKPVVFEEKEGTRFYYPIKTNSMCLQCHGLPKKNISAETLAKLSKLYPQDEATGYDENQIRGIWSIYFEQ